MDEKNWILLEKIISTSDVRADYLYVQEEERDPAGFLSESIVLILLFLSLYLYLSSYLICIDGFSSKQRF